MNRLAITFCLSFFLLISCNKKDPCDMLINGAYQFPVPDSEMTFGQKQDHVDLPPDIAGCISTPGLVETCMNYPYLMLILAGSTPQSGYDYLIRDKFRGVRELEQRPDRGSCLLEKYKSIDPLGYDPSWEPVQIGEYHLYLLNFEVIFSQYPNLIQLTKQEQIELVERAISIYEMKKSNPGYQNHERFTAALMGRLMLHNNYQPMVEIYESKEEMFNLLDSYGPVYNFETVELVNHLAYEYLQFLKNM